MSQSPIITDKGRPQSSFASFKLPIFNQRFTEMSPFIFAWMGKYKNTLWLHPLLSFLRYCHHHVVGTWFLFLLLSFMRTRTPPSLSHMLIFFSSVHYKLWLTRSLGNLMGPTCLLRQLVADRVQVTFSFLEAVVERSCGKTDSGSSMPELKMRPDMHCSSDSQIWEKKRLPAPQLEPSQESREREM